MPLLLLLSTVISDNRSGGGSTVRKGILTIVMAGLLALAAPVPSPSTSPGFSQLYAAEAETGMKRLNLIIKKLRSAMASMKDFDALEKAGLSKKDVNRMRSAMQLKIQQLMEDAIYAIRSI